MSAKLDQSLDDLTKGQGRRTAHPRRVRPRRAVAAPAGGIKKNNQAVKTTARVAANLAAQAARAPALTNKGGAKVIVSNLPLDVQEGDIKKYFQDTCGPIRSVSLAYGPNGKSRGLVTILFNNPAAAQKAVALNRTKVDDKPMKIELVLDAATVAAAPSKGLGDRIATAVAKKQVGGKGKPKSAATAGPKSAAGGVKKGAASGGATKGKRNARPKKKTAEELDAEMTDYFGAEPANGAQTSGATPVVADSMEVS